MTRLIECHQVPQSYLRAAKYEEKQRDMAAARRLYERALAELGKDALNDDSLFIAFTKFEVRQRDYKRAKTLFKYALDNLPMDK